MGDVRKWSGSVVVASVLMLGATAACSSGTSDTALSERRAPGPETAGGAPAQAVSRAAASTGGSGSAPQVNASTDQASTGATADRDGGVGAPLPAGLGAPKVVKTASLVVRLEKGRFAAAFSDVASIAAAHGGFVASSTSSAGTDEGRLAAGTVVVRIPADRFDEARRQLVGLGRLASEEISGQDVGGQLADLEARLRNLRIQEEAIRTLMAKATTVGETIQVQQQLSSVREQVEQLSAEQARLSDAVAFSTLTVSLSEPGAAVDRRESRLADSAGRALDAAEAVLAGAILALGYLIPLGALGLMAWLGARTFLRGRRLPTSPPAAA